MIVAEIFISLAAKVNITLYWQCKLNSEYNDVSDVSIECVAVHSTYFASVKDE